MHIDSNHVSGGLNRVCKKTNLQSYITVDQENIDTTIEPKNKNSRFVEIQKNPKLSQISQIDEPYWPKYDVNIICV